MSRLNAVHFNYIMGDVYKARKNGMKPKEIMKEYDLTPNVYYNWMRKYEHILKPYQSNEGTYSTAPIETDAESSEPKPEIAEKKKASRPKKEKLIMAEFDEVEEKQEPIFDEFTNERSKLLISIDEKKYQVGELKLKVTTLKRVIKSLSAALKDFSSLQLDDSLDDMYRG